MNSDSVHVDAIYPIYIPENCYFTTLLIRDVHNRLLHAGTAHTLSQIRTEYWIHKGRKVVRSVLLKCMMCRRYQGGPYKMPKMMSWPLKKVTMICTIYV